MILLQRPSSEQRLDCHSFAGRRLSLGRHKQCLQDQANCAEAWGTPPRRWAKWRGAAEEQRAGPKGPPPPATMGIGRRSGPREFQLTGGAASSLSKMSPTQSGWTLTWQRTGSVCQSGGPPGSERQRWGDLNHYHAFSADACVIYSVMCVLLTFFYVNLLYNSVEVLSFGTDISANKTNLTTYYLCRQWPPY